MVDPTGVGTIIDDDRDGTFSCTGTAANVLGITAAVANPANLPCADDSKTVADATLNAGLISSRTDAAVGDFSGVKSIYMKAKPTSRSRPGSDAPRG